MADVLDEVEAALRGATTGPWRHVRRDGEHRIDADAWPVADCGFGANDAKAIVTVINAAPALVERCRRAEAVVKAALARADAKAAFDKACDEMDDDGLDGAEEDPLLSALEAADAALSSALAAYRGQP